MTNWTQILTIINFLLVIGGSVGFVLALRGGKLHAELESDERLRQMYHDENELLLSRVSRVEADNKHLHDMLDFVIDTLAKVKNITLSIDDSIITMREGTAPPVVRRLRSDTGPLPAV